MIAGSTNTGEPVGNIAMIIISLAVFTMLVSTLTVVMERLDDFRPFVGTVVLFTKIA